MYEGLTHQVAEEKLREFGKNEIEDKKEGILSRILRFVLSPITLMLLVAAGLSYSLNKIFDVYFILSLAVLNAVISFWHEKQANDSIEKVKENLAIKSKVFRDSRWQEIDAKLLVPDDIVKCGVGDIIPADLEIIELENFSVNESGLTGESLPVEKSLHQKCFAGSFAVTGYAIGKITATGENTNFGQTLVTVEKTTKRSLLEKDILSITKFLTILSIFSVVVLSVVFIFEKKPILELITLGLSLVIAGIPISLPTVLTLIISIGTIYLAKRKVIVRKIASLENLSNVDLLLTDKTGTLTKNQINLVEILPLNNATLLGVHTLLGNIFDKDDGPINEAIGRYLSGQNGWRNGKVGEYIPYDSERKHSTSRVVFDDEKRGVISFGAPQVIIPFCALDDYQTREMWNKVNAFANDGYRALALAYKQDSEVEDSMELLALVIFSDVLREDSAQVIDFLAKHGVDTKIISGDNFAICRRVASELNLNGEVYGKEEMKNFNFSNKILSVFKKIRVFSEVLPIQKHEIVEYAKKYYTVAVTGDGVNDIPPIKASDCGIAVKEATDSLKSMADIAILKSGLSVIKDAVIESRKIFARLNAYAIYRISESFRLIFSILILGIICREFPLSPIQLIILALLNDIPIISLAFNRVEIPTGPAHTDIKKRTVSGALFGLVGIGNSLLMFYLAIYVFHLDWQSIQTMFFLKLSVSGHLLIYVAHTEKLWYKYFPSKQVIWATTVTQLVATSFALFGFLMKAIDYKLVLFIWIWAFFWMQISELTKILRKRFYQKRSRQPASESVTAQI